MRVIDCMMFYNELNMLKYRLAVLNDTVDLFVIVEATHTHSGKLKPLYFRDHIHEFDEYKKKIVHVVVDDFPFKEPIPDELKTNLDRIGVSYAWKNENFQRNAYTRGLDMIDMKDDDRILIGDCDTIMDPKVLQHIKNQPPELDHDMFVFFQDPFCYTLNYPQRHIDYWAGLTLFKYGWFKRTGFTMQHISDNAKFMYYPQLKAGWHLTYFGDSLFVQNKLRTFAHQELNTPELTNIDVVSNRTANHLDFITGEPMQFFPLSQTPYLPPMYRTYLKGFFTPEVKEPKVVDGFMFYNELNMLEYRLTIMDEVVDHFILVESTHTQNGKEKPLFFEENKQRYAKWLPKIVHIIVRDVPYVFPKIDYSKNQQWVNEHHQRNCIARGIEQLDLRPKDIIMISDLDEITDPLLLRKVRAGDMEIKLQGLDHLFYYYNLNTRNKYVTDRARILTYEEYDQLDLPCHSIREKPCPIISPAGWHLSYFGDTLFIQNKIRSIADFGGDDRFTDVNHIESKVKSSADLFNREGWGENYRLINIDVKDNTYLPPLYTTHLRSFYTSVAVIVNSCLSYYKTTLPFILKSATEAKIPLRNLYIVIGECDEEKVDSSNGYTLIFTRYVNVDCTGVVYFTQTAHGLDTLKQYTHFFYIHDTSTFMEHFWTSIQTHAKTCSSYIKLAERGSKSSGLFSVDWFIENKKELMSYFANTDKSLRWNYKTSENFPKEEFIRAKFPNLSKWLNEDAVFIFINKDEPTGPVFENNDPVDYSNLIKIYSDQERLIHPFKNPGVIKYQINWGQPGMQWKTTP